MEDISLVRYLLAFAFVLGLIGLFALILRKTGNPSLGRGKSAARLQVVETCRLDPQHRLLLVRRDTVEHVLLLGPESAAVVESGIKKDMP